MMNRRGVVLLEVLLALTILAIAGISAVTWIRQVSESEEHARQSTQELLNASDYLDRIALWPREDLDRHLGTRRQGVWSINIMRPTPTLYDVIVLDSTATRTLLATTLYRPEPVHAQP